MRWDRVKMSSLLGSVAQSLVSLPPRAKLVVAATADTLMLVTAALLSSRRLMSGGFVDGAEVLLVWGPFLTISLLFALRSYRAVVRFIGLEFIARATAALVGASGILYLSRGFIPVDWPPHLLINYTLIGFALLVISRSAARALLRPGAMPAGATRVLIYGAGSAGTQLASALSMNCTYRPVGFVDDRRGLQGRSILGLPVHGAAELARLKARDRFDQVLLAIPSATHARRREILEALERLSVKVLVMPGMDELASGRKRVDDFREVQIEDLLRRDPVDPVDSLLHLFILDKSVMVTGAGGSIGSELCRQVLKQGAKRLVLFEVSEYALYRIDRELRELPEADDCQIVPVLGSILDEGLLSRTMERNQVETIYHAAAYKHVPLVEGNVISAVRNNVLGTLHTVQAAIRTGVRNIVLVSTDKAVRPTNVMGASKRMCELVVQALAAQHPEVRMSMVRFGNVLASSGSVVPLFREQIARGGPLTVTHEEVTRYFMTIPEAAQLVIQAGSMGHKGEVFVLDMGEPVKIRELAERMIHLSGLQVVDPETGAGDIEIQYTGLRPGEKLYEELLIGENPEATAHPRIFKAMEAMLSWTDLNQWLERLRRGLDTHDEPAVIQVLVALVSGFVRDTVPALDRKKASGGASPRTASLDTPAETDIAFETGASGEALLH